MADEESTGTDGQVIATRERLSQATAQFAPLMAAHADELERERRMPTELVAAWRDAGITSLWLPAELDGAETAPEDVFELVESIAALDGAVGWNLLIAISSGLFGAYLPEPAARTIWSTERAATFVSGSFAPMGRAVVVDGGYRVSGRWPFASGIQYADWVCANCVVIDGERPRTHADGTPRMSLMFLPIAGATVLDTWHTGGMRGTGSHHFTAQDVFVPGGFEFDVLNDRGRVGRPAVPADVPHLVRARRGHADARHCTPRDRRTGGVGERQSAGGVEGAVEGAPARPVADRTGRGTRRLSPRVPHGANTRGVGEFRGRW